MSPKRNGITIQNNIEPKETKVPNELPKNFLNTAPVIPISAEISKLRTKMVRERLIGFKTVKPIKIFSKG